MGLIKLYRSGFTKGINPYQETQAETGMDFDILIISPITATLNVTTGKNI